MAHPGTLPTINREAVKHVLRVGAALGGKLADYAEFDRKSYFYPDIPKGYQISQYVFPLVSGGELAGVPVTRVHLEEDTARSIHESGVSLVDFNRAGVPLMELVTEPAIHDPETAGRFARELQLLLRTLNASNAELAKGEMRIEANISVSKTDTFGTKVEVKNLNSFRSVERAIAFEIDRHITVLEGGGTLSQETRGWDEENQKTFSQRLKEGSADYRYFPEPDLPKLRLSEIPELTSEAIYATLPELPWERRARYIAAGLKEEDALTLTSTIDRCIWFDRVLTEVGGDPKLVQLAANVLINEIGTSVPPRPEAFIELIRMSAAGEVSSRGLKDIIEAMLSDDTASAREIAERAGLLQVNDMDALRAAVREVIAEQEGPVGEYRNGKEAAIQFLVGQTMKKTRGAGNPGIIQKLLKEELA